MTDAYEIPTARVADAELPRRRMDWRGAAAAFVALAIAEGANVIAGRDPPTLANLAWMAVLLPVLSLATGRLVGQMRIHWAWGLLLGPLAGVVAIVVLVVLAFVFFALKAGLA